MPLHAEFSKSSLLCENIPTDSQVCGSMSVPRDADECNEICLHAGLIEHIVMLERDREELAAFK
jgi:hypothetical protein